MLFIVALRSEQCFSESKASVPTNISKLSIACARVRRCASRCARNWDCGGPKDVKPAVWRRVLVPHDATIRTLHETVQVVMGWANCHLHEFIIHGKEYGVAYEGGISFADNPDKVRLSDFRFQPHEGFEYVYDLGDNWEHDIRVEKILALDPARAYPVCIGGAQPCPPEDSGGP